MDSFTLAVVIGIGIVVGLFSLLLLLDRSNTSADRGGSAPR